MKWEVTKCIVELPDREASECIEKYKDPPNYFCKQC
jgi:hypothetical protein